MVLRGETMAADGSVVIEILGDAKDITSKLAGIASGAVKTLTTAIAGVGTALSGVSAAAIKVGSSFEQSMSQVAATMGLSVEEIQSGSAEFALLSQAAKDAGATTAFSASEAASALNYLALAGYDAETAVEVLPSVLNLASAGGMDLAYASDLATDAMAALGIEASNENLTQFGDQMAKTASKANTSVGQLGEAILTVGGTAKSLAGGTTELNAALGVLANRGIKGAEGGTALRNIILSLSAPTDKAAGQLERLGVAVYDAEGKMRPLNDVFADLDSAMQGMTEGEKTNVLNDIFNKVDLKSAQALLAGTGEEFDSLADAIKNSQGAMQDMADVQLDNLTGDITILKSGLEGLGIALYETMQVNARDAVQSITGSVGAISEALTNGGIPAAIQVAGQQIAQFATAIAAQAPDIINSAVSLIQAFLQGIQENTPTLVSAALDIVSSLASGILELLPRLADTGFELLLALADGIIEAIPKMTEQLPQIITGFVEFVTDNLPAVLDAGLELLLALAGGIIDAIPDMLAQLPQIISALVRFFSESWPKIKAAGYELLQKLGAGILKALPDLLLLPHRIMGGIVDGLITYSSNMVDVGRQLIEGMWNGIADMASWIKEKIQGFGQGVLDSLKDFFGIHSPSRVVRDEVGEMIGKGLAVGIENSADSVEKSTRDVGNIILDALDQMNSDLEQQQLAAEERRANAALAEQEAKVKEKYQKLASATRKERDKIHREIANLEASWNEKQLKAQEKADEDLLKSQIKSLEQVKSEYQKACDSIGKERDSLSARLADYGDLFTMKKRGDREVLSLNSLQEQIGVLNRYADTVSALKDRGISKGLLSEIVEMDVGDATAYGEKLLALPESQYEKQIALWEEKQRLAAEIATGIYEEEFENLNADFLGRLPESIVNLPEEMEPIGQEAIQSLIAGMESEGEQAVAVAAEIADGVAQQLSRIGAMSGKLKEAVENQAARISASLTVSSNAPAEARRASDTRRAAENASANAAFSAGRRDDTFILRVGDKDFYRGSLNALRQVEAERPEVLDDR